MGPGGTPAPGLGQLGPDDRPGQAALEDQDGGTMSTDRGPVATWCLDGQLQAGSQVSYTNMYE